jgi:hypothetical protein
MNLKDEIKEVWSNYEYTISNDLYSSVFEDGFVAGVNSKWVQAEKIKFALEKLRIFKDLRDKHGYFGGYDNGQVIDREVGILERQLKQLEDDNS